MSEHIQFRGKDVHVVQRTKSVPEGQPAELITPDGYRKIKLEAFTNGEEIIICVQPGLYDDELPETHNCNDMGCGTLSHVIHRLGPV